MRKFIKTSTQSHPRIVELETVQVDGQAGVLFTMRRPNSGIGRHAFLTPSEFKEFIAQCQDVLYYLEAEA